MSRNFKIVEQYQDYSPPVRVNEVVLLLMRYVPVEHLEGLRKIVMTNSASLLSSSKGKFVAEDGKRLRPAECLGLYSNGNIFLVVDHIMRQYPEAFLLVPFFKKLAIGEILYHEVGHHIHKREQPGYRDNRETFADEWRDELLAIFFKARYWYLMPILRAYARFIHPRIVKSGRFKSVPS